MGPNICSLTTRCACFCTIVELLYQSKWKSFIYFLICFEDTKPMPRFGASYFTPTSYCQTCYSALWKDAHRVAEACSRRRPARDWFTGIKEIDLATFEKGSSCLPSSVQLQFIYLLCIIHVFICIKFPAYSLNGNVWWVVIVNSYTNCHFDPFHLQRLQLWASHARHISVRPKHSLIPRPLSSGVRVAAPKLP